MATRKEMKNEALNRMRHFKLHRNAIIDLDKYDKLNRSDYMGALFWLTDEEKNIVKDIEEKYGCLVYHAIFTNTEFGRLLNLLIVSQNEEEWECDWDGLYDNYVFCYVVNLDDPNCSEFGDIVVAPCYGGLIRIG